jgi:desulfoferrodoxin (superoxide reductase-like protein)
MQLGKRVTLLVVLFVLLFTATALADKTAVEIEAPETAKAGSTIPITIHVRHSGNSFFHYTDWVRLMAGTTEIARWEFTRGDRPEDEVFTRQIDYTITETTVLEATGNCNLHGGAGPSQVTVIVE